MLHNQENESERGRTIFSPRNKKEKTNKVRRKQSEGGRTPIEFVAGVRFCLRFHRVRVPVSFFGRCSIKGRFFTLFLLRFSDFKLFWCLNGTFVWMCVCLLIFNEIHSIWPNGINSPISLIYLPVKNIGT